MKKGFTLIELLAVIVILAIIALIATPIILGIINDAREESNERSVELYASAVRNGIVAYQLRTGKEIEPKTYKSSELDFVEYDGEVECDTVAIYADGKIYVADCEVNGALINYTYGTKQVIKGNLRSICNPISVQTEGVYTAGDKYECDVDPNKEGYDQMFYVLTTVTDPNATSVNLIMDSNIRTGGEAVKEEIPRDEQKGLVAWITKTDYKREDVGGTEAEWNDMDSSKKWNKGPITAIEYLQTATIGWTNVNPQTINTFDDDKGNVYNMAKSYIVNARMPYYSEISSVSESTLYLIDYLYGDEDADENEFEDEFVDEFGVTGRNGVSGVDGYWTLSSDEDVYYAVRYVNYSASVYSGVVFDDDDIGVRPVINLSID